MSAPVGIEFPPFEKMDWKPESFGKSRHEESVLPKKDTSVGGCWENSEVLAGQGDPVNGPKGNTFIADGLKPDVARLTKSLKASGKENALNFLGKVSEKVREVMGSEEGPETKRQRA